MSTTKHAWQAVVKAEAAVSDQWHTLFMRVADQCGVRPASTQRGIASFRDAESADKFAAAFSTLTGVEAARFDCQQIGYVSFCVSPSAAAEAAAGTMCARAA